MNKMNPVYKDLPPKNPTPEQKMVWLETEVRRVKIQRNIYEQRLMASERELVKVKAELTLLENYVNRTK